MLSHSFYWAFAPNHNIINIQFTVFKCHWKNVSETGFCLHFGFLSEKSHVGDAFSSLLQPSLSLCFPLPHTYSCAVHPTQTEFISLHGNTGVIRKKKRECSTWTSTDPQNGFIWLHSSKITVFQPCSGIIKSLSSDKWSGKGTIKVKPNQGNVSRSCWPRKLPSVRKIHRQKKLFPMWFPSFCLPLLSSHKYRNRRWYANFTVRKSLTVSMGRRMFA